MQHNVYLLVFLCEAPALTRKIIVKVNNEEKNISYLIKRKK